MENTSPGKGVPVSVLEVKNYTWGVFVEGFFFPGYFNSVMLKV